VKKDDKKEFKFNAKKIPASSGCYLFWDKNEQLLYIGKAKNLKKRVSSYFQKSKKNQTPRTEFFVKRIAKIETRATESEMEALILENNLVKEFRPRFNVRLKDDKSFVYLRITKEEFPKMEITRKLLQDGSTYIGPKTSAKEFRDTVRFCQKFFKVKMVKSSLDYYPLVSSGGLDLDETKYNENVELMKQFLRGKTKDVFKTLKQRMMKFAEDKNFEAAARTRDLIKSIEVSTQKQTVQFDDQINRDFINFVRDDKSAYFVRIAFRNGKLLDQNNLEFSAEEFFEDSEIIEAFLLQFYEHVADLPTEIFIPAEITNTKKIEKILTNVKILIPQKGDKQKVIVMAQKNAKHFAAKRKLELLSQADNFANALPELAETLKLKSPPRRMECFDISHFCGTSTVASQVVFLDGIPKKSEYRRFNVKTLPDGKVDDFAAMTEILERRFARIGDKKFAKNFPDLIVIDGGKGQLSSVMKAVKKFSQNKKFPKKFTPTKQIIALAKREEQIFRSGRKDPLELDLDSSALKLLQRIRDEAHRFAITFNRSVREKVAKKSVLDSIPSIGNTTRKKLIQKFGSLSGIKEAKDKNLLEVLTQKQLENLRKNI